MWPKLTLTLSFDFSQFHLWFRNHRNSAHYVDEGHGVLYRRQLDMFQFLKDVSPLIQEAPTVLTNWRGVCWLLHSVWVRSYGVIHYLAEDYRAEQDIFESWTLFCHIAYFSAIISNPIEKFHRFFITGTRAMLTSGLAYKKASSLQHSELAKWAVSVPLLTTFLFLFHFFILPGTIKTGTKSKLI